MLVYSLNNLLSNLFSSLNKNAFISLDKLVFVSPDITKSVKPIIGLTTNSGLTLVCNSLIFGFLLYYAFSYLLSHLTFSKVESPSHFIFKLLLCAIALNSSEVLCSGVISFFSQITNIIIELGKQIFDFDISFIGLIGDAIPDDYFLSNSFNLFSFDRYFKSFHFVWFFKS